jgi:hypothetical protein
VVCPFIATNHDLLIAGEQHDLPLQIRIQLLLTGKLVLPFDQIAVLK